MIGIHMSHRPPKSIDVFTMKEGIELLDFFTDNFLLLWKFYKYVWTADIRVVPVFTHETEERIKEEPADVDVHPENEKTLLKVDRAEKASLLDMEQTESTSQGPCDLLSSDTMSLPDSHISAPALSEPLPGSVESSASNSQRIANITAGENISNCSSDACTPVHISSSPNQTESNADSIANSNENMGDDSTPTVPVSAVSTDASQVGCYQMSLRPNRRRTQREPEVDDLALDKLLEENRIDSCSPLTPSAEPVEDFEDWVNVERILKVQRTAPLKSNRDDSGRDGNSSISSTILEYTHFVKFRDQSYWHCNWIPGNTILFMHPSMVKNYHRKHADELEEADAAYEAGQQETAVPSSDGESGSDTEENKSDTRGTNEDSGPAPVDEAPLIGGRLVLPKIGPQPRRGRRRYFYYIAHGVDPHYLYPESVLDVGEAFPATLFSKIKKKKKKTNKAKGCKSLRSKIRLREVLVKWSHLDAGQATWETVECDLDHLKAMVPAYSRLGEVPLDPCGRRLLPIHVRRWILQLADAHLSHLAGLYCAHLGSADDARVEEVTTKRQPVSRRPMTAPKGWHDAWMKGQPSYLSPIEKGVLYPYQLEGARWLRHSLYQGINTILADEMGLGKTVQVIAMLYSLYMEDRNAGPFLVVAPLCTVINWEQEFFFWAPEMRVVVYAGDKNSRAMISEFQLFLPNTMNLPAFNVLITTYELFCLEKNLFTPFHWPVLVVDEAHRLRNRQSRLFRDLSVLDVGFKILLTGTPLQNNLEELFHLLNFLDPKQFNDSRMLGVEWTDLSKEERISSLHNLLKCHLLRRMKRDVITDLPKKTEIIVPVDLTLLQKRLYKLILTKDYHELRTGNLMNTLIHLQKVCDHPYLMPSGDAIAPRVPPGQEEAGCYEQQALVQVSSKLHLVMRMLAKLRSEGHRVLIFCHLTKMLDLIEIALANAGYPFERIDGSVRGTVRQIRIDRFNSKDAEPFVFLLSTRAGGEGINLASADTVILFDSDWNPHCDLQALARAHRIGQSKQVLIYRLIARATVEERILQVARRKLALTKLVIDPRRRTAVEEVEDEETGGSSVAGKRRRAKGDPSRLSRSEAHMILKNGLDLLFADDEGENDLLSLEESLQSISANKPPLSPDTSQPTNPTERDEAVPIAADSEVTTEAAKPRLQPLVYTDAALDQLLDRNRETNVDEPTREADDYLSVFKSAHFGQGPDGSSLTKRVDDAASDETSLAEHPSPAPLPQSVADNEDFDPPTVGQKEIADFWDRLLRVRHERVAAADRSEEADRPNQFTRRSFHSRHSQAAHDDKFDGRTDSDDSDMELDSVHVVATASGHALLSSAGIKAEPLASQARSRKSRRVPKPTYTSLSNFHRVSRGDIDARPSRALRGRGRYSHSLGEPLLRTGSDNEGEDEEAETEDEEGAESADGGGRRRGSGSSRRSSRGVSYQDDDTEDPNYVPSGSESLTEATTERRRRSLQISAQERQRRRQKVTSQNSNSSNDVDDVPMAQYHLAALYRTIDWSNAEPVYAHWRSMVAALGDEVTWTEDRRMLVYGFNAHDRQMFLDSVMRFGLPPKGVLPPQEWLPMCLRSKPPVHLFAYTALFMRHLYDDPLVADDNAPEWSDGLPKEGVSGLTVLSRIGMMSLIRNKVIQFEDYNAVPRKHRTHSENRFRFTIHEGGLTLLSTVWRSELSKMGNRLAEANARLSCPALEKQRRLFSVIHRNWHHRHDFWLLAGIHVHGYAAWPEIIADRRFSMIPLGLAQHVRPEGSEPPSQNLSDIELAEEIRQHFSFSAEVHSFLLHRLRLLEQALLVEQGLFSVALAALSDPDKEPSLSQVMALTSKLSLSLASKGPHKHLSLPPDSHVASAVRNAVKELHLLLEDLYADLPGLPAVLTCDGVDFAQPRFFTINSPPRSRVSPVSEAHSSSQVNPPLVQSSPTPVLPPSLHSNAPSDGRPVELGNCFPSSSEGHAATTNSTSLHRVIGSTPAPRDVVMQAGRPAVAVVSPLIQNSKTPDYTTPQQANTRVTEASLTTSLGDNVSANRTPPTSAPRGGLCRRSTLPEVRKAVRLGPGCALSQQDDNSVIVISDSD
ncbi:hypothetical protein SprV_0301137700 [Sparganum proliferum]